MAKDKNKSTEKKKRKGIVQRMMFGDDQKPDITPEQMNMSSWETFKFLFFHRFGTMAALSLLSTIFAIPMVAVILIFAMNLSGNYALIPFSSNLGVGYPVVIDAAQIGMETQFVYKVMQMLVLVPCIMVFSLGIAGNLYVIRKLIWEEPTSTVKDFFRGIKKCWLPAVVIGMVMGFTILLFVATLDFFDVFGYSTAAKVVSIILASILLVFVTLFSAFLLTQNAAFKMRPVVLIRNSALFVFGTHILSIIFIGIAVAPTLLFLIPDASAKVIIGIIYALIGVSFTTLVTSVYCHSCYKRYLYDKIEGKPKSANYQKRPTTAEELRAAEAAKSDTAQKKRQPSAPYKNPKKRKKSIDEGTTLTPLSPTFRREDLERLEKEHQEIMQESEPDDDADEVDDELTAKNDIAENELDNAPETPDTVDDEITDDTVDDEDGGDTDDEEFAELTDAEKWL